MENSKSSTTVIDRTLWYSDLTTLDPSKKNETWAAQSLFFMKRSGGSQLFLDPVKAAKYRKIDNLDVDIAESKNLVDPKTPMGEGGKAEYFSSDFKANPIYIHLKNIVKSQIEKTGKQIEVNITDKYAKTRKIRDNYRILYQREFRSLINHLAGQIGIPGVKDNQDPYKWVERNFGDNSENTSDVIDKYIDLIRNEISDSQDFALYNEYIYKGDYEQAFELGLKYYIFNLNKWHQRWADEFIDDIMHFNKACGTWTTDLITGRPIISREVPESLFTSPFKRKDGEDIMYYWTEYDITFGDFMRTIGRNLREDKLKEVFEINKQSGAKHGLEWIAAYELSNVNLVRDNALIRIGKAAFLSTDMEVQMEDTSGVTPFRRIVDISWEPQNIYQKRIEKRYNVWRWWYYIPPVTGPTTNANWEWQSQYIFQLQKFQDQQRYGDDGRYAKSPLVIYDNSSQATFTDIVQSFMPKINHAWHKYQNCLVNDLDATILSEDFIAGLLGAVDEGNKVNAGDPNKPIGDNGKDAYMQQWKMIQQSGRGFLKMTDTKGVPILDPNKLVVKIQNGYLEKAESYITQIMMMYDMMIKSLAFSPVTAGEEIKPRTPVAYLDENIKASESSRFFIQKGYEEFLKMFGERIIRYIIDIGREYEKGDKERFQEFIDNVGLANGLAVEGIWNTDPESIGMTVDYVDNTAQKEFVMNLAMEYVKTKELSEDFLYLIMGCDNWKYSFVLMRMGIKKRREEMAAQSQQQHQQAMELKKIDLQMAITLQQAKDAGKDQNIVTQGKVDDMINQALNAAKFDAQAGLKQLTDQLKKSENEQLAKLDMLTEQFKSQLPKTKEPAK